MSGISLIEEHLNGLQKKREKTIGVQIFLTFLMFPRWSRAFRFHKRNLRNKKWRLRDALHTHFSLSSLSLGAKVGARKFESEARAGALNV
jgi:hypothetical protein